MNQISGIIEKCENKLKLERTEIENKLMEDLRQFTAKIEETKVACWAFKDNITVKKCNEYNTIIADLKQTLKDLSDQMKRVHEQQTDLEMMLGEYPLIEELKVFILPFEEFWKLQAENIVKMKSWKSDNLSKLNPDEIEGDFKKMQSASTKLYGRFDNMKLPKPRDLANAMKEGLMKFRPTLPIIRALCNPGLMERHKIELGKQIYGIKKLSDGTETCEQIFNEAETTSDDLVTNLGALGKKDLIEEISEKASKEFSNEKAMTKMRDEWEPLEFMAISVPGKDSYILSGESVELIQTALDDHIIKTQTMKGSPFAKFMLDKIIAWETTLLRT